MSSSIRRASGCRPEDAPPGEFQECPRCGTQLPRNANYCLRCGERRGGEPRLPDAAPLHDVETCRIVLWSGYVESRFYAVPAGGPATSPAPLASSRFRRLSGRPPTQEGRALAAYEALVERLRRDGWEPVAQGPRWYQTRLRRLPDSAERRVPPPPGLRAARPGHPKT